MIRTTRPAVTGAVEQQLPVVNVCGLRDKSQTVRRMHERLSIQRNCALTYLVVAGVILYTFLIPFTAIYNVTVRIQLPSSQRGLLTPAVSDGQLSNRTTKAAMSSSTGGAIVPKIKQWDVFWASSVREDLQTLQNLKHTIDHMRYQHLTKDVEYQGTAGLDVMLASSLHKLASSTELYKTQEWLQKEVTDAVFAAINKQQYPSNCSAVRRLVCNLGKNCGFGCELHHAAHCLSIAIATNRTMILQVYPSNYIKTPDTWEQVFAATSSCTLRDLQSPDLLPTCSVQQGLHESSEEVFVDIIDGGPLLVDAPAMPADVLDLVKLFHGRPHIWWQGVLISWLLRPSLQSQQRHADFRKQHNWSPPIVGVHVRRTDKLQAEAKLHQMTEYMTHVERFCDVTCHSGWQQRAANNLGGVSHNTSGSLSTKPHSECSVYLATDDETVVAEVKRVYSHIHVITNPVGTHTGSVQARYSNDGLLGIYDDIIHLAHTDFLVGTFSSQVSRLAYEIAQVNTSNGVTDAAFHYHSVDSQWYFGGQQSYKFCLADDYTDKGQQKLKAGQQVICPIIYAYQAGYMVCYVAGSRGVSVPPGSLRPCKDDGTGYRRLLPAHMHEPQIAVW